MEDLPIEITGFLTGIIFLAAAAVMLVFPPKKINSLYGYRTSGSMKSQQRWDFAQRYSSWRMVEAGIALLVISVVVDFFGVSPEKGTIISLVLLGSTVLYLLVMTERALNKKFPNS